MITVSFMFIDSINNVINTGSDSMGSFKYEYVLNKLRTDKVDGADELVIGKYEYDGSTFSLIGTTSDVKYLNIETTDNGKADIDNGYYVTNVMAYAYKLKAGDEFSFVNPTTMEEKKVTIKGIIKNDSQKMLICSQENARKLLGWNADTYNGLWSDRPLELGDAMMVVVFRIYSGIEGVLYKPVISIGSILLTIIIVAACYIISLLIVRHKADRVDMVESLKDNRE